MSLRKSSLPPSAADDTAPLSTPAENDDEYYTEGVSGFGHSNPPPPESFEPAENPLAA